MQTRYVERSNSMAAAPAREKRGLDSSSGGDEGQPERKRPALASVQCKQVSEEVERALAKLGPAKLTGRSSPKYFKQNQGIVASQNDVPSSQQEFLNSYDHQVTLPIMSVPVPSEQPVMDSGPIVGGMLLTFRTIITYTNSIEVKVGELLECCTVAVTCLNLNHEEVTLSPGYNNDMAARFSIHSQNGNLNTPFQFDAASITLQNPMVNTLQQIQVPGTDNLLALAPPQSSMPGFQSFGTLNLNSYRGTEDYFAEEEIRTRSHEMLENEDLQNLLRGFNMGGQGTSFNVTEDGYPYSSYMPCPSPNYCFAAARGKRVLDSSSGHDEGQPDRKRPALASYESLTLDFKQHQGVAASQNDVPSGHQDFLNPYDHQDSLPTISVPVPSEQPVVHSGPAIGGYADGTVSRFSIDPQNGSLNTPFQFDAIQNSLGTNNLLALGPPQSSTPGSQGFCASDLNLHRGKEDFFSEDEIRTRSHDMLENEDMQQLLRIFNMGGQGLSSNSVTEDGYPYSSYIPSPSPSPSPSYSLSDNPSRSSGKAVVGWLKLKAALRWGIFVRKKAAERRAQLVELDDS
ncbi:hypothetical protein POTOM_039374 [Populus tomentosa]|uniref:Calmodulin-binding protein n=1 Tax=Populus tomentosa TaxID=118781 RepID=A0A8X8CJ11_POPTO|nr:hypothetical protein POTOM_039374 [Populus tomentosa]